MSGPHKKGGHEEGGGHAPMWIVSFADMVILLMSFFVLLLCKGEQKTTANEDLLHILASVKLGFGYVPKPNSKEPIDVAVLQVLSMRQKGGFEHSGQRWASPAVKGSAVKEYDNFLKAQATIGKPVRFASDSAIIPKSGMDNIEQIAELVRHHYRSIIIQGHCTQEEALHDSLEGDDLAIRRALAVKTALKNHGVSAARLRIVSCSSDEPLKNLSSPDKQLVVVTIGSYFLPTDRDVIDEGSMPPLTDEQPAKKSGGH